MNGSNPGRLRISYSRAVEVTAFAVSFLAAFVVYVRCLAPNVTLEDSGELAVAADYLGVPNPPGYSVWTLQAWFFQWLFHGASYQGYPNPAWAVALSSAFWAAMACGFVAMLITASGPGMMTTLLRRQRSLFRRQEGLWILAGFLGVFIMTGFGHFNLGLLIFTVIGLLLGLVSLCLIRKQRPATDELLHLLLGALLALVLALSLSADSRSGVMLVLGGITILLLSELILHGCAGKAPALSSRSLGLLSGCAGISAALLMAFTPLLFSQAVIVEVHSLTSFFMALLLWLAFAWTRRPERRWPLYLIAFVFGLALTNHQAFIVFLAPFLLVVGLRDRRLFESLFWLGLTILGLLLLSNIVDATCYLDTLRNQYRQAEISAERLHASLWLGGLAALAMITLVLRRRWWGIVTIGFLFNGLGLAILVWQGGRAQGLTAQILMGMGVLIALLPLALFVKPSGARLPWCRATSMIFLLGLGWMASFTQPIASEQNPPINEGHKRRGRPMVPVVQRGSYERITLRDNAQIAFNRLTESRAKEGTFLSDRKRERDRARSDFERGQITAEQLEGVEKQYENTHLGRFFFFYQLQAFFWGSGEAHPFSLANNFTPWLSLIGLIPLMLCLRLRADQRAWLWWIVLLFLCSALFFMLLQYPKLDLQDLFIKRVHYLQAHVVFAILIGYGGLCILALLAAVLGRLRLPRPAITATLLLLGLGTSIALPSWQLLRDSSNPVSGTASQRGHDFGWQFGYYQLMGAEGILADQANQKEPASPLPDDIPSLDPNYPPAMEPDAILFGGTDPGRFVLTYMVHSAKVREDVFVLTQNALADGTYMNIMRDLYGDEIWLPSNLDSNQAFSEYDFRVSTGREKPGAHISMNGGRMQVEGVHGVMKINAILCEYIHQQCTPKHAIYVEESYQIPWMDPYLKPHGLIMRLHAEPAPLTRQDLENDSRFWRWYTWKLTSDPAFQRDIIAQKTFSKLRGGIGGLYQRRAKLLTQVEADALGCATIEAARTMLQDAAAACFLESIQLFPDSPEAVSRYANLLIERRAYDQVIQMMQEIQVDDPDNANAGRYISSAKSLQGIHRRMLDVDAQLKGREMNPHDAYAMLGVFCNLAEWQRVRHEVRKIADAPAGMLTEAQIQRTIDTLLIWQRWEDVEYLVDNALRKHPESWRLRIEKAAVELRKVDRALSQIGKVELQINLALALDEATTVDYLFSPARGYGATPAETRFGYISRPQTPFLQEWVKARREAQPEEFGAGLD